MNNEISSLNIILKGLWKIIFSQVMATQKQEKTSIKHEIRCPVIIKSKHWFDLCQVITFSNPLPLSLLF